jgi:GNAT superfamily N-acetyltransferase
VTISAERVGPAVVAEVKRLLAGIAGTASRADSVRAAAHALDAAQTALDTAIRADTGLQGEQAAAERLDQLREARDAAHDRYEDRAADQEPTALAVTVGERDDLTLGEQCPHGLVPVLPLLPCMETGSGRRNDRGMDLTIRRGTGTDARAAADLWLRARRASSGAIPPAVHDDDDVRAWFASHVVPTAELWVAEDSAGMLIGILVLDGAWVEQLSVEPTMTRRGVGARLLNVAKRERPEGLRLWTFVSNLGAQRFYERHGFVTTRRTDGRDNEERAPDILYVWDSELLVR